MWILYNIKKYLKNGMMVEKNNTREGSKKKDFSNGVAVHVMETGHTSKQSVVEFIDGHVNMTGENGK
jgi:uncharacterized protein YeeX (DUF496 family)